MNYKQADEKLQGRNKDSIKVANNTHLQRRGEGKIALKLHDTDIITWLPNGETVFYTGGYQTVTTKSRMNEFTPSLRIYQKNYQWYWSNDEIYNEYDILKDVAGEGSI